MGHVSVGHRWDRVGMDILDMSVSTPKGNLIAQLIVALGCQPSSIQTRVGSLKIT